MAADEDQSNSRYATIRGASGAGFGDRVVAGTVPRQGFGAALGHWPAWCCGWTGGQRDPRGAGRAGVGRAPAGYHAGRRRWSRAGDGKAWWSLTGQHLNGDRCAEATPVTDRADRTRCRQMPVGEPGGFGGDQETHSRRPRCGGARAVLTTAAAGSTNPPAVSCQAGQGEHISGRHQRSGCGPPGVSSTRTPP